MDVYCKPQEKIIKNHRNKIIERGVRKSLPVANALELLKLVFLSRSSGSDVQASLAATLQLYSESEIFTAVSLLKEKNFLVSIWNLWFLWYICSPLHCARLRYFEMWLALGVCLVYDPCEPHQILGLLNSRSRVMPRHRQSLNVWFVAIPICGQCQNW